MGWVNFRAVAGAIFLQHTVFMTQLPAAFKASLAVIQQQLLLKFRIHCFGWLIVLQVLQMSPHMPMHVQLAARVQT